MAAEYDFQRKPNPKGDGELQPMYPRIVNKGTIDTERLNVSWVKKIHLIGRIFLNRGNEMESFHFLTVQNKKWGCTSICTVPFLCFPVVSL